MRAIGPSSLFLRLLSFVFLLTLALPSPAQSAPSAAIQSFKLITDQSGFVLASNRLFWTDTLGKQWTEITPPAASTNFSAASFQADGTGYVVGHSSSALTFAHTADNGKNWITTTIAWPFTEALQPNGRDSISFADAKNGFLMLGVQSGSAFRFGILLTTTDGGATWTQLSRPPVGGDITFLDAKHGFNGPGPEGDELYTTLDGGTTWQQVSLAVSSSLTATRSTTALPVFADSLHGTIIRTFATPSGETTLRYTTTDGGATWTPIADSESTHAFVAADGSVAHVAHTSGSNASRASFGNATNGFVLLTSGGCKEGVCTQTSSLRATADGGRTFTAVSPIAGISPDASHSFAMPATLPTSIAAPNSSFTPDSSSVYNTAGVMGFDACSLPTTAQMTDWYANSPYKVVGIYIGGANFSCKSGLGSLTASYISALLTQGWQIIPIWVGPQGVGACTGCTLITDPSQGTSEADSAVAAMTALGLGQGSPIVYDMEAYTRGGSATTTSQQFIEAWDTELHNQGYLAAVYSSHPEFTDWYPTVVTPAIDTIWYAYFYVAGKTCVGSETSGAATVAVCDNVFPSGLDISSTYWVNNHRMRQNSSSFNPSWGSTTINVDEDWVDAAMVTATPNTLTVAKTGTGTVTSTTITNPNGDSTALTSINCGATCSANFASTDTVTLTATPAANYTFSSWTGCTTTSSNMCTVTVNGAMTVTAAFVATDSVTVIKTGNGTGTVTSADGNINCGTTCSSPYNIGTSVVLTATATNPSSFAIWTGCTSTTGNNCTVTVSGANSVTALFTAPAVLTVTKTGTGTGTITSADGDINCGATCSFMYPYNTSVTLTAAPATGTTFAGWSGGGCSGTGTCVTTLTAATTVVATLNGATSVLTVNKAGTGSGTVTSTSPDSQINCGAICTGTYTTNTTVVLHAVPATGSIFTGWSGGGCTGTGNCSVKLAASTTVTPTFNLGTVTPAPAVSALSLFAGGSATDLINFTTNNWTGTVSNFACSGQPTSVTCSFSPTSLTFTSNTTQGTTLTVTVPSTISLFKIGSPSNIVFAGLILPGLLLPLAFRRRWIGTRARGILLALFVFATLGAAQVLTGCSGNSTPVDVGPNFFSGPVTITYTATPTTGTPVNASTTVTLTIPRK